MYLNESLETIVHRHETRIAKLEEEIATLPEGTLHIYANGRYYTWVVVMPDGRRIYLPKSEEAIASQLALKSWKMAQLHDLKNEAEAYMRSVRYQKRTTKELPKLVSTANDEYRRLLGNVLQTKDTRIADWLDAPYEKFGKYPEGLIYPTLRKDEKVRSKIEVDVANGFYLSGVPYLYERVRMIGNVKMAPDFTALDVRTFQEIPVEVFGMMDNPEYRRNYKLKMKTYVDADYIPGVNFLVFYESSKAPLTQNEIMDEIQDFFFKKPPIRL